ncbi:hypothetical protein HKCCE2091_04275 [Rhodobacterales bacterium HKCCE2091]|nr:hypothetical protein [Rhodobacterales bacterium HKCCE2091]
MERNEAAEAIWDGRAGDWAREAEGPLADRVGAAVRRLSERLRSERDEVAMLLALDGIETRPETGPEDEDRAQVPETALTIAGEDVPRAADLLVRHGYDAGDPKFLRQKAQLARFGTAITLRSGGVHLRLIPREPAIRALLAPFVIRIRPRVQDARRGRPLEPALFDQVLDWLDPGAEDCVLVLGTNDDALVAAVAERGAVALGRKERPEAADRIARIQPEAADLTEATAIVLNLGSQHQSLVLPGILGRAIPGTRILAITSSRPDFEAEADETRVLVADIAIRVGQLWHRR